MKETKELLDTLALKKKIATSENIEGPVRKLAKTSPKNTLFLLIALGEEQIHEGNWKKAIQLHRSAKGIALSNILFKVTIAEINYKLGYIHWKIKAWNKAIDHYIGTIFLLLTEEDRYLFYQQLAECFFHQKEWNQALRSYLDAAHLGQTLQKQDLFIVYEKLGDLYLHLGDLEETEKYYLQALLYNKEMSPQKQIDIYSTLAEIYEEKIK